ncbi:MAG: hypothetical protein HN909_06150 [Phycisphaerales bacterium]|jgi:hypothetical protein|nr:hypothetical protein [Phycisphaerales bacterium]MBT7171335.1 hypothetical protein [Phycisphaerales bacterium]
MSDPDNKQAPETQIVEKVLVVKEVERSTIRPLTILAAVPLVCLLVISVVQWSVWPFLFSSMGLAAYLLLQRQILDRLSHGVRVVALVEEPIPGTISDCTTCPMLASPEEMEEPADEEDDSSGDNAHWSEEPYPDPDEALSAESA